MIGCKAPSGELPLAEARSGKALLQVQVTHSVVYLSGAAARLQPVGAEGHLLGVGFTPRFPSSRRPAAWGRGGGEGRGQEKKKHLPPLGIVGRTEGLKES